MSDSTLVFSPEEAFARSKASLFSFLQPLGFVAFNDVVGMGSWERRGIKRYGTTADDTGKRFRVTYHDGQTFFWAEKHNRYDGWKQGGVMFDDEANAVIDAIRAWQAIGIR